MAKWIFREPREEPKERPGRPGRDKRARGAPPGCFKFPWFSEPSFWLFPGLPDNPPSHPTFRPAKDNCHTDTFHFVQLHSSHTIGPSGIQDKSNLGTGRAKQHSSILGFRVFSHFRHFQISAVRASTKQTDATYDSASWGAGIHSGHCRRRTHLATPSHG